MCGFTRLHAYTWAALIFITKKVQQQSHIVHTMNMLPVVCPTQIHNGKINDLLRSFDGAACPDYATTNVCAGSVSLSLLLLLFSQYKIKRHLYIRICILWMYLSFRFILYTNSGHWHCCYFFLARWLWGEEEPRRGDLRVQPQMFPGMRDKIRNWLFF